MTKDILDFDFPPPCCTRVCPFNDRNLSCNVAWPRCFQIHWNKSRMRFTFWHTRTRLLMAVHCSLRHLTDTSTWKVVSCRLTQIFISFPILCILLYILCWPLLSPQMPGGNATLFIECGLVTLSTSPDPSELHLPAWNTSRFKKMGRFLWSSIIITSRAWVKVQNEPVKIESEKEV